MEQLLGKGCLWEGDVNLGEATRFGCPAAGSVVRSAASTPHSWGTHAWVLKGRDQEVHHSTHLSQSFCHLHSVCLTVSSTISSVFSKVL